jgi:hypothetical protein
MSDLFAGGRGARRLALVALASCALAGPVAGQVVLNGRERLDFDRPEAWGMKFAAAALTFGALDAPRAPARGALELALEAASVPQLTAAERRIGFNGTKEEALDRTSATARLRLSIGLGRGFALELHAVPPLELDGIDPRVAGVGVTRPLAEAAGLRLGGRLAWDHGTLQGDITCSRAEAAAGGDLARNPLGCERPSDDRFEFDLVSAELTLSRPLAATSALEPYLTLGAHRLDGTLRIRADYQGLVDRTRLETTGTYGSAALGLALRLDRGFRATVELDYASLTIHRPDRAAGTQPLRSFRLAASRRFD